MTGSTATNSWDLGSDLPVSDPANDAYGYAPFASQIARAIVSNSNPHGLVLAIHGTWGSGKSSLLNFIKHDLTTLPEHERPVLVSFNPWWFEGREQIATQLLGEFSAQLPDRLKVAKEAAKQIGRYAKAIGSTAATYSGHPWVSLPVEWIAGLFSDKPKGIPAVKAKVAKALKDSGKRFVFLVDDIDRLTPDEAQNFFRAIKALADFPEVVYVLFFDREAVAKALTISLDMDGEAYLEKIIQAPFHLPAVDKGRLCQKLFAGLDSILQPRTMPFPFDQARWTEVFHGGVENCVKKPRDIVRVLNAISVTYPPLAGEVNPVDFIGLEVLRIFEPGVYDSIRDAKEFFCGTTSSVDYRKAEDKAYFEKWRESLPQSSRTWVASLVGSIFPKVAAVLDAGFLISRDTKSWRRELRPCSPECFAVYFQFSIPVDQVTRAELNHLISQDTPEEMATLLLEAKTYVFPDGHSKVRDLLERLRDFDKLEERQAAKLVEALVSNAHLLLRSEDERGGFFGSFPNRWRIFGLVQTLLEQIELSARQELLMNLAESSPGLWGLVALADDALAATRDPSKASKAMVDLEDGFPSKLANVVAGRLDRATQEQMLAMPELDFIVNWWATHGDATKIRGIFEPSVANDAELLGLLDKFVRTGSRSSGRISTETYHLSMKPLALAMDLDAAEPRIRVLQLRDDLTTRQRASIDSYLKGLQRIHEGKNPDGVYFDDPID